MYQKYYSQKKSIVVDGLKAWKSLGKSIAVWGGGARGREFLELCDPNRAYIDCVFDIDPKKSGLILPTGHIIADYRSENVDIVIFIDPVNTLDSIMTLKKVNMDAKVCCLENVYWGGRTLQQSVDCVELIPSYVEERMKKVYGVTILYNPNEKIIDNIKSYLPFIDKLYLCDNSPYDNRDRFKELSACDKVLYRWKNGENQGIGTPINNVVDKLSKDKYSWLVTFDQDSKVYPNMFLNMRNYIGSNIYTDDVGVVAPIPKNLLKTNFDDNIFKKNPYMIYKQEVMQSGSMYRLDILDKLGGFNEELFIDQVDLEFCARCRLVGIKIVQIRDACMYHQIDDENCEIDVDGKKIIINKYSPSRYYYQYRNQLYLSRKYKYNDAVYSEQCMNGCNALKRNAMHESHEDKINIMISKAKRDAECGYMGKYQPER